MPSNITDDEALASSDRTIRRMNIINAKFPGVDSAEFMTVPTVVSNQMTGVVGTKASIHTGKVKVGGLELIMEFL